MKTVPLFGLLLLIAAGPATQPATTQRASGPSVHDAKAAVTADATAVDVAKAKAVRAFDATAAGKRLAANVADKEKALEQARATGAAQDKLDASSAFNRARGELEEGRAAAISADRGVAAALLSLSQDRLTAAAETSLAKATADKASAELAERVEPGPGRRTYLARAQELAAAIGKRGPQPVVNGMAVGMSEAEARYGVSAAAIKDAKIRAYLQAHDVPPEIKNAIWDGEPAIGMTREQVEAAGLCLVKFQSTSRQVVTFYLPQPSSHETLVFEDGKLASITPDWR